MAILRVTMQKQYSIAEARDKLASIVHEVEKAGPIKLTRRGKPVAVLIAESEYERLRGGKARAFGLLSRDFEQRTTSGS
jgi:prevent-host-death family protein